MTIDYTAQEIFYFAMIVTSDPDTVLQEALSYHTKIKNTIRSIGFQQDYLLASVLLIPLTCDTFSSWMAP